MANSDDGSQVLTAALPFLDAGFSLHWLKPRSKAPAESEWSTTPVQTADGLRASYRSGANLGVRLGKWSSTGSGYVHLIDVDVRKEDLAPEAFDRLSELFPQYKSMPMVRSGSGGSSRHVYFITDTPFNSRLLARSDSYSMVWDTQKQREVKKFDWEIELFGTGKQAVVPPSVHPDSGRPYEWIRDFDLTAVLMGFAPQVPSDQVEAWGASQEKEADIDDIFAKLPMGLADEEIRTTLADLPFDDWCEGRDGWLQVGMALHHEYEGSSKGLAIWTEFSKRSEKFEEKNQKATWKSFGRNRNSPVRMATLIKAASVARLERDHGTVEAPQPAFDDMFELEPVETVKPPAIATAPIDPEWRSHLQITEDGCIKMSLHNVKLIIRNDPRFYGVPAFNEFTQEVVQMGRPGRFKLKKQGPKPVVQLEGSIWELEDPVNGDLWSDSRDNAVRAVLEAPPRQGGYGLRVPDRDLRSAIDIIAHEQSFHPVRSFLEAQEWDGKERIETLFTDFLGAEDNEYHRMAARLFMIGAVTRVFEPGHKFDYVPMLEGLQGKRKSTFVQVLASHPSWFAEMDGDFHDSKGMVEKMQGAWILELPELDGFSRAEITTIKAFVSRLSDKVRLAYAKRASVFKRQCVFIGTTNEDTYLRDSTGNRRFWPVRCDVDEIDADRLKRERFQLWAEAVHKYRAMRAKHTDGFLPLYLSDNVAKEQAEHAQSVRMIETAEATLAGRISKWLDSPSTVDDLIIGETTVRNEVCGLEIWIEMLGQTEANFDQRNVQKVANALKQVPGWYNAGRDATQKYGRQRVYRRNGYFPLV